MKHRLIDICQRLIQRTNHVLEILQAKLLLDAGECDSLHQIAIAATQERQACESECDNLRMIEDAAWEEYWNCITP